MMRLLEMLRTLLALLRDPRARAGVLSIDLPARETLQLRDARGWLLECRRGATWITQEGDTRDTVLPPGGQFALDRDGLALVVAVEDAHIALRAPAAAAHVRRNVAGAGDSDLSWLRTLYPDRPWTPPSAYRRMGML